MPSYTADPIYNKYNPGLDIGPVVGNNQLNTADVPPFSVINIDAVNTPYRTPNEDPNFIHRIVFDGNTQIFYIK